MWLVTTKGFFSVVKHWSKKNTLVVRARVREDLIDIAKALKVQIISTPRNDYPFRIEAPQKKMAELVGKMMLDVDYPNFKSEIGKKSKPRELVYHNVWGALRELERLPRSEVVVRTAGTKPIAGPRATEVFIDEPRDPPASKEHRAVTRSWYEDDLFRGR